MLLRRFLNVATGCIVTQHSIGYCGTIAVAAEADGIPVDGVPCCMSDEASDAHQVT
jgi:hypothetical protein